MSGGPCNYAFKKQRIGVLGQSVIHGARGPDVDDGGENWKDLKLKDDHENRPLWVTPKGDIILDTSSQFYKQAYDFLIAIAEPVSRLELIHEYTLTENSLYAAASVGIETDRIIRVLDMLSKNKLHINTVQFIRNSTANYGKARLILKKNRCYVESEFPDVLKKIMRDPVVKAARIVRKDDEAPDKDQALHSFEIDSSKVDLVKERCMPQNLGFPLLEEYDFKNNEPEIDMKLKPIARLRPYQEKSLSKMFANGRARSGLIVLPCGAGKSLVGVAAAARLGKTCLCLATNSVSVEQWAFQFKLWSTIKEDRVFMFTADTKADSINEKKMSIVVTTYSMVGFTGKRSKDSEAMLEIIKNKEWGLLLMDEVHVAPAETFSSVIKVTKSHCKLGLTATLLREDERIEDLNFLVGPKLFEANWLDLVKNGYLANVECAEVLCPMQKDFFREYLRLHGKQNMNNKQQVLYTMNPNKFGACQFLINYHENGRGDKIIVFSDNLFGLKQYALKLAKPMIHGGTSHMERQSVIQQFKSAPHGFTLFLSKVGDASIDIPEANVIIQISSHGGSRRQEAQRLGRILRPKGKLEDRITAGGKQQFNAFFYSLISTDTVEMMYATKRQEFLVNQGYTFKSIKDFPPAEERPHLHYYTKDDQLSLLEKALNAKEEDEIDSAPKPPPPKSNASRHRLFKNRFK